MITSRPGISIQGCTATLRTFWASFRQGAPADRGCTNAQPQEAERRLTQDHVRDGQGEMDDEIAHKPRQQMLNDDLHIGGAGDFGRDHKVRLAHFKQFTAHDAGQPAHPIMERMMVMEK